MTEIIYGLLNHPEIHLFCLIYCENYDTVFKILCYKYKIYAAKWDQLFTVQMRTEKKL